MPDSRIFQQYELDAYLGDFSGDFDVDAILAEATEVRPDGNRYWKEDVDLAEICERHDLSASE